MAVVSREGFTLKKNRQKVVFPELVQLVTFNGDGKVTRQSNAADPTALLAAWRC